MVLLVGVQGLALSVSMSVSAERKDPYTGKIEKEKKVLEKLRGTIVEKRKKSDEVPSSNVNAIITYIIKLYKLAVKIFRVIHYFVNDQIVSFICRNVDE